MREFTYSQKLAIANGYLISKIGIEWDDLADINSLHDCDDEECIIEYCDDRLEDAGYNFDLYDI